MKMSKVEQLYVDVGGSPTLISQVLAPSNDTATRGHHALIIPGDLSYLISTHLI